MCKFLKTQQMCEVNGIKKKTLKAKWGWLRGFPRVYTEGGGGKCMSA